MTHTNEYETIGYNKIMGMVRDSWDPGDQFASVQEWRFAICELLLFDFGHLVPEFRTMATAAEGGYAVECIRSLYVIKDGSTDRKYWYYQDDMLRVLVMLDRYRVWLGLAGEDY